MYSNLIGWQMSVDDFSFRAQAPTFQSHIARSIPGYGDLIRKCVSLSRRFVRSGTIVVDVGCSTGETLHMISEQNAGRSDVNFIGLDIENAFAPSWDKYRSERVSFVTEDVRTYAGYVNCSLVTSMFILQFLKEGDRLPLLKKIQSGLIHGGAVLIAEKVLASTSRLQDALTFPFYDHKLSSGFTESEVLTKERRLRGQMVLWTQDELQQAILDAGFVEYQVVWSSFPFIAILAMNPSRSSLSAVPDVRSIRRSATHHTRSMARKVLRAAMRQSPLGPIAELFE